MYQKNILITGGAGFIGSHLVRRFVNNYPDKNILVIEMTYGNESYFYGFLNEKNEELSNEEIEKRFFRELK